jgi:hypothetical protein
MTTSAPTEPAATIEELAGLEFQAWEHHSGEWRPPSNDEWAALANPHLISIRLAWLILHKSKVELVDANQTLGDDGVEALIQQIGQSAAWLKGLQEILLAAECRMMSAYAIKASS